VTCVELQFQRLPDCMWSDEQRAATFQELYRLCYAPLVDLCRRMLCGHGDPEAVAQEAFERAWTSLDRFSGSKPFWPWVATIARRLCIDQRRRLERQSSNLHVEATISEHLPPPPDELVEVDEEHRCVREALLALRPADQRVITLRDVDGWSYDEIARVEGVTTEAIRSSLKRARASLRRSFSRL
jgi:RNA polymerase sigma-70 factor (ECF subfamily)